MSLSFERPGGYRSTYQPGGHDRLAVAAVPADRPAPLLDGLWRTVLRVAFPLARICWRVRGKPHEGALVAVYVGESLLLVQASYRNEWNLPGGSIRRGETPEAAACRELAEELGVTGYPLLPAGSVCGHWDGRQDRVHIFEVRLGRPPVVHLDNREIIAARLVQPSDLPLMVLTGPVVEYLRRAA